MKRILQLMVLLVLAGCGSGETTPAETAATAAKLAQGEWDISYNVGTTAYSQSFTFNFVLPETYYPSYFLLYTTDGNAIGTSWKGVYVPADNTWTIQNESAEYVFQTDGSKLSDGACLYELGTDGTKSQCIPITGIKRVTQ